MKEKLALKEIKKIIKLFIDTYGIKDFFKWDGNISIFSDFEEKLEDEFVLAFKKFKSELW